MLFEWNNLSSPLSKPGVQEKRKWQTESDRPVQEADTLPGDKDCALDPADVNLKKTFLRE